MATYCGDCLGVEMVRHEGRLYCPSCGPPPRVQTGRLTRNRPNLQNIPIRTPEGARIRESLKKNVRGMTIDHDKSVDPDIFIGIDWADIEKPSVTYHSTPYTGGGVFGACHECGCAWGECEC